MEPRADCRLINLFWHFEDPKSTVTKEAGNLEFEAVRAVEPVTLPSYPYPYDSSLAVEHFGGWHDYRHLALVLHSNFRLSGPFDNLNIVSVMPFFLYHYSRDSRDGTFFVALPPNAQDAVSVARDYVSRYRTLRSNEMRAVELSLRAFKENPPDPR